MVQEMLIDLSLELFYVQKFGIEKSQLLGFIPENMVFQRY